MPREIRSKAKPAAPRGSAHRARPGGTSTEPDDEPLSPELLRDLRRQVRDLDDRNRYLIVSVFGLRFVLYYNVSDDVYIMNDPSGGTLFKRRKTAEAVVKAVDRDLAILHVRVQKDGSLKRISPLRPLIRWNATASPSSSKHRRRTPPAR